MTTGKTIALTRRTFVHKVMSLLFNMLSIWVITFLPRSKCLLTSWLQSPSAVILEPIFSGGREVLPQAQGKGLAAKSLQSCPTLCNPIDGSPPGSPVPGILQARTLEWVAISFSNAWKWKVKVKSLNCVWLLATRWTAAYQAPLSMGFFQARVLEWGTIAFSERP